MVDLVCFVGTGELTNRSIVAVSGLNGHAYGSWRGRGKSQRMWLGEFMREDFPDCRTMIYGYNSKLDSRGTHTILDYAKTFLEELTKARGSQEVWRVWSPARGHSVPAPVTFYRETRDRLCSSAIVSGVSSSRR